MNNSIDNILRISIKKIIERSSSNEKITNIIKKHDVKLHFIPKEYRIFNGILQSMNIQFGNFLETFLTELLRLSTEYNIIEKYNNKRRVKFYLLKDNDSLIDKYISDCDLFSSSKELSKNFSQLQENLIKNIKDNNSYTNNKISHDIDLLFKDKEDIIYYVELKCNDDHDTGKFIDINRKFLKTYACLLKELNINNKNQLKPILFYFNNKKMKDNKYIPEDTNIMRGEIFFKKFNLIDYKELENKLLKISEDKEIMKSFNDLYHKSMNNIKTK